MEKEITIFNKQSKKFYQFSKVNIFFGYNTSGKTNTLNLLNNIFIGKDRNHLVNGTQTINGDFNVFYFNSKSSINDHLKLNSKSLLKRLIEETNFSSEFEKACQTITNQISIIEQEIDQIIKRALNNASIDDRDINDILELILSNISIDLELSSSSEERNNLINLVNSFEIDGKTIVIIDDFDNDYDEESIISFLNMAINSDYIYFLSTKKSLPQFILADDKISIFVNRNKKIYSIPYLPKLISLALNDQNKNSYEDYVLNNLYLDESLEKKELTHSILNDVSSNLFRIFNSKKPTLSKELSNNFVTIIPKNNYEEKFYSLIFNILDIIE